MDFNKDYKGMNREQRLEDKDWREMKPLERLAAIGMLKDIDGSEITLEEQYNQRFITPDEMKESFKKIKEVRLSKMERRREDREKKLEAFKNKYGEIDKKVAEEFETLLK